MQTNHCRVLQSFCIHVKWIGFASSCSLLYIVFPINPHVCPPPLLQKCVCNDSSDHVFWKEHVQRIPWCLPVVLRILDTEHSRFFLSQFLNIKGKKGALHGLYKDYLRPYSPTCGSKYTTNLASVPEEVFILLCYNYWGGFSGLIFESEGGFLKTFHEKHTLLIVIIGAICSSAKQ